MAADPARQYDALVARCPQVADLSTDLFAAHHRPPSSATVGPGDRVARLPTRGETMTTLIRRLLMVVLAASVGPTPAAATPATARAEPVAADGVQHHSARSPRWSRHDLRRIAWSARARS
jgi:hypothetical protein